MPLKVVIPDCIATRGNPSCNGLRGIAQDRAGNGITGHFEPTQSNGRDAPLAIGYLGKTYVPLEEEE